MSIEGDCDGHVLTGHNLMHVDPKAYPYCNKCGAQPRDGYQMQWFSEKQVDARNRRLGLGKYVKKQLST